MNTLKRSCRAFIQDQGGTISILGALALAMLIGFVALVAEYGSALEHDAEYQRIADAAAYSAALHYTGATSATALQNATTAAQSVAALNGVSSTGVAVSLTTNPSNASQTAVQVTISGKATLLLAPVIGAGRTLTTAAISAATAQPAASPCIVALSTSGGVTLSGGTSLSAPTCAVSTNASVAVPCGTTLTAQSVTYHGAVPSQPCSGIRSSSVFSASVSDPLAANSGVLAAEQAATAAESITGPAAPSVAASSTTITLGYYPTTTQTFGNCAAAFSNGNTWTVTCSGGTGGVYNLPHFSIGGGINFKFNVSSSSSATYNFPGAFYMAGSSATFGPGTYNFASGYTMNGGSTNTFTGGGTYNFGPTASCNGSNYSICATAALSFTGSSNINLSNGIYVGGGTTVAIGSGSANTYDFGAAGSGAAIYLGGGAKLTMADATSGAFNLAGNFDAASGGGSCATFPAAPVHHISGWFNTAGGTILGAGLYAVGGYFAAGYNDGGSVWCDNATVGAQAPASPSPMQPIAPPSAQPATTMACASPTASITST